MNISVMMASGEADEWVGAEDAVDDRGSLLVLYRIEGEEVPGNLKTIEISREVPQPHNGDQPGSPAIKTTTYQIAAQYAPGMWMKVEFDNGED